MARPVQPDMKMTSVDGRNVTFGVEQRLPRIGGFYHPITITPEDTSSHLAELLLVFHDQDRFRPAQRCRWRLGLRQQAKLRHRSAEGRS